MRHSCFLPLLFLNSLLFANDRSRHSVIYCSFAMFFKSIKANISATSFEFMLKDYSKSVAKFSVLVPSNSCIQIFNNVTEPFQIRLSDFIIELQTSVCQLLWVFFYLNPSLFSAGDKWIVFR